MSNIILLGAPGSGKGTLAQFLVSEKNYTQLSTGDLLRSEISKATPLGAEIKSIIDKGNLVSDSLVISLIEPFIKEKDNLILDGFPRTTPQAEALEKILFKYQKKLDSVIFIDLPEEIILERLTGRWTCPSCGKVYNLNNPDLKPKTEGKCDIDNSQLIQRDDDKREVILQRLQKYAEQTSPLIDFYEHKGLLKVLKAGNNLQENKANLLKLLE